MKHFAAAIGLCGVVAAAAFVFPIKPAAKAPDPHDGMIPYSPLEVLVDVYGYSMGYIYRDIDFNGRECIVVRSSGRNGIDIECFLPNDVQQDLLLRNHINRFLEQRFVRNIK